MPPGFFSGLNAAASSPNAFAAYVCLVIAWTYVGAIGFQSFSIFHLFSN